MPSAFEYTPLRLCAPGAPIRGAIVIMTFLSCEGIGARSWRTTVVAPRPRR
jgi:hypothetical protein